MEGSKAIHISAHMRCEQVAAEACLVFSVSIALSVLYQNLEPGWGKMARLREEG